ncbi:hypothetical protein CDD80_3103 [Ophiocordyceps camponoti-rufipedis]|uniref:Uncharacterized protein n=1 Tax=Ophiocordyceps camponoti-rufipedis TaxID=2004952 RepID=A0A2C5Y8L6_9HYPO|nr:hypothetical protein CDD80_3103 [Ophiocordyceps camponoti-rufipedis]
MRIFWTLSGRVSGIGILKGGRSEFQDFHFHEEFLNPNDEIISRLSDIVTISSNDWVTGLVIYTHTYTLDTESG